ncbi:MAG: hypothetical protein CM15mP101_10330 [Flavobacteriaceae bacterium]|nr:MAG: hypothetical protein CM15mP101_10330 [Flavobacteriaceae bacterium]
MNKKLLKAACCNLSESFETNPAVDVNHSDALTGSKNRNARTEKPLHIDY